MEEDAMPYWRLHYHLVWATKDRMPLITLAIGSELHGYLIGKADALGAIVHSVESVDDHIHLVASVPPKVSVSDFVGQLKGASAHHINYLPGAPGNFGWQRGYGAISVSPSGLDKAIEYVRNQKTHHRENTIVSALECIEGESSSGAGE
jgi:REP element-mobilizing transposase RayT